MLKLLIFDLDGTLADTGRDITDALNYALGPFGAKTYSVEETKAMVGSGISTLLESLIPPDSLTVKAGQEHRRELVTGRFLEYYAQHLLDNTRAYPHVKETLSQLGQYKKAVLSNKREKYSRQILEELRLSTYFDTILGSDSVRQKKPSPVPVLDLMSSINVSKDETAIIGDSNYDIESGKAAGVKVIGATYGFRSREFLRDADLLINSFDELLNVLPKINQAASDQ
jgi:phosphoglycolate phosphatase